MKKGYASNQWIRRNPNLWSGGAVYTIVAIRTVVGLVASAVLLAGACDQGASPPDPRLVEARRQLEQTRSRLTEVDRALERMRQRLRSEKELSGRLQDELTSLRSAAEHTGGGSVVTLPLLGELRWDCNDRREFAFTFRPTGATVTVQRSIEGEVTREIANPGDEVRGSYEDPGVHQEWAIRYRHKPGVISALVVPMPGVEQGACYIRNFVVEQTRAASG